MTTHNLGVWVQILNTYPLIFFYYWFLFSNKQRERPLTHSPLLFQTYSCYVKVASHSSLKHYEIKVSLEKLCGAYATVQVIFQTENLSMCKWCAKHGGIGGWGGDGEVCSVLIGTSFLSSSTAKFSVVKAELWVVTEECYTTFYKKQGTLQ